MRVIDGSFGKKFIGSKAERVRFGWSALKKLLWESDEKYIVFEGTRLRREERKLVSSTFVKQIFWLCSLESNKSFGTIRFSKKLTK